MSAEWRKERRRLQQTGSTDPVVAEWDRRYPSFPGVAACLDVLRRRGSWKFVDCAHAELELFGAFHPEELIAAFAAESDPGVRISLVEVLSTIAPPGALALFAECLRSENESVRTWAERGLRRIDTPESRKALWEAGSGRLR